MKVVLLEKADWGSEDEHHQLKKTMENHGKPVPWLFHPMEQRNS